MILVYKITKSIHILDINTMRTFEIDQVSYWKNSFKQLLGRDTLTEFVVLDIESINDTNVNDSRAAIKQKFKHVKVEVARKSDLGQND
jgi:NMD protein affecting ribosome stability and mRNA decay